MFISRSVWLGLFVTASAFMTGCGHQSGNDGEIATSYPCQVTAYTGNGYPVCWYDISSVDGGYVTQAEIFQALDQGVEAFIYSHPDLNPENVRGVLRGVCFEIVDNYAFLVNPDQSSVLWAAGVTDGKTYIKLALWSRGTTEFTSGYNLWGIPAYAPPHVVYGPDHCVPTCYPFWRFGSRPLLPALSHEVGHIFYGPCFEHICKTGSSEISTP